MDHKVSKDMISSGMIPSGEKTQADLGRTQYGSAPSPSSLMDAYKSIYEHHKKDADGNTIPHEGEELNESIMGAVAKGLRGASKVSKNLATSAAKADKSIKAQGGLKNIAQKKLQSAKTKLAPTSGQKQALLGRTTAGKITRGVAALGAANIAGRMSQDKPSGGYNSYSNMQNFHYVPDGDTLSEDLFDALKSALIEEGCDEKSAMKIMASITPEFINETIQEENLDEALPLLALAPLLAKGAMAAKAGLAAAKATKVGMAAIKGAGAIKKGFAAMKAGKAATAGAKVTSSGGKVLQGASGASKGGNIITKTGGFIKKKPLETAMVGSMAMPQGGAPKPEAPQRGVTSGKRTAGMQNMDLDLFDVVKGQLLDEGLTEEEVLDVMTTLTIDEIQEGMGKLALKTGAVVAGGVLAKKGLDKAKEKVDDALNKARDNSPIGGNKRPGADKIYFGK